MNEKLKPYYDAALSEAERRQETQPLSVLEQVIADQDGHNSVNFRRTLTETPDVAVIAEHKRKSPSEGEIRPGSSVRWTAEQYQLGGATALSILTQETHFGGSVEDIFEARQASMLPILRKDFISSEYQLYQAKAYGADAALLIVGGLGFQKLVDLQNEASEIGLDCLVEVHDRRELHTALESQADLIGINNRNLSTLQVDISTTEKLIAEVPADIPVVAESGYSVRKKEHIEQLRELNVDAVLMGTALMREDKPAQALKNWIG